MAQARSDGERRAVDLDRAESVGHRGRRPDRASTAVPGTAQKVEEMRRRIEQGQSAFHDDDRKLHEGEGERLEFVQSPNGIQVPTGRTVKADQPREGSGARPGREFHRPRGFPSRLARLRKRAGLSQKALAMRASISRVHLFYLETGRRIPRLGVLVALADALKLTLDDLIGRRLPGLDG